MYTNVVFATSLLLFTSAASAQNSGDTLQDKARRVFEKSCATCHVKGNNSLVLVDEEGAVDWVAVKKNAEEIIEEVSAKKMPPPRAPSKAKIDDQERSDLLDYVKSISVEKPGPDNLDLSRLQLPDGFSISLFAAVPGARTMAVHPSGIVFVGTGAPTAGTVTDTVYAIIPHQGGAPTVTKFASGLDVPNGVALNGNDLYVAEQTRVIVFKDAVTVSNSGVASIKDKASFSIVRDGFPKQENHYWKYLAIGPDHKIYVPIGANCNVCLPDDREQAAGIFRMNLDGSGYEQIAKGVRNTVGFDWDPASGDLWFTDNGRDLLGDDVPSDELNHLGGIGQDFGFPFCFATAIVDPDFGGKTDCGSAAFSKPAVELGAHVAALGLTFYRGNLFPDEYRGAVFVAEHGSWNRTEKSGYRLRVLKKISEAPANSTVLSDNSFISGWLDDSTQENWGRPVDVKNYVDGSLLISDDDAGVLYQVRPTAAN